MPASVRSIRSCQFWPPAAASISVNTSVSLVAVSPKPRLSSSSRSAVALTRLPLWATDSGPCMVSTRNGWMLRSAFDPVVEYRVWPIEWYPVSGLSASGEKTVETRPGPLWTRARLPSLTAMPAASWPRCWSANNPKNASWATPSPCGVESPSTPHSSCAASSAVGSAVGSRDQRWGREQGQQPGRPCARRGPREPGSIGSCHSRWATASRIRGAAG